MTNEPNADAANHAENSAPPNPYANWPAVGSTIEKFMSDGDWAALTAEWLRLRHDYYNGEFNT
jgi:uncharacterized membrane-anchored protein